jgi:hypothetical protein
VLVVVAAAAVAQEKKKEAEKSAEEQGAEFMMPGPEHAELKRLVGDWKAEVKSFMPDPNNPTTSEAKASFKMILGGRFVQQNFTGSFDGQEFEGIGISGYDRALKKYVGSWIDSMGTGIMHTEGTFDPKSRTITETGSSSSPMGTMKMKMLTKHIDDNKFHFTMFMIAPEGGEQKMMEITYTRKK